MGGGLKAAVKHGNSWEYRLTLNKFPYAYSDKIAHFVFWYPNAPNKFKRGATRVITGRNYDKAKRAILSQLNSCTGQRFEPEDVVVWENPDEIKSIKDLWHMQVLVKDPLRGLGATESDWMSCAMN